MKLFNRLFAVCICAATLAFAGSAMAGVMVVVDKSEQLMHVYQDGSELYTWKVSTGLRDSWTPTGTFRVQLLDANHYSSKYGNAPMPWAVFFNGNVAVHGTIAANYQYLGGRASHGCVRLHQTNAKTFFGLVQSVGPGNVQIIVQS